MRHLNIAAFILCASALAACSSFSPPPTPTNTPPPTLAPTLTPSPTVVPTATPLGCLSQQGELTRRELDNTKPPQEFLIYLPPCYTEKSDERYPVLYLLHGQTYQDDQWVQLGAAVAADNLIHSGEAPPFIIVFPDDRYWNLPPGDGFGDRLIHDVIPFVDKNYRTLADRDHRALGGLSRGGGWAIHMLLTEYGLFGTIGLHSPVIFKDDALMLEKLISNVPSADWPRLWLDAGDRDGELGNVRNFEALLSANEIPHEWRMYAGDHTNPYWQAHITEYLQWYVEGFQSPEATPTP
jgi:enterochelin esterase-like enzyme